MLILSVSAPPALASEFSTTSMLLPLSPAAALAHHMPALWPPHMRAPRSSEGQVQRRPTSRGAEAAAVTKSGAPEAPSTPAEPPTHLFPCWLTQCSLPHRRPRLSLGPHMEKTSPPWPQDVSTISIGIPCPILSAPPQALGPIIRSPASIIHINIFPDFAPVLDNVILTNIPMLFTTVTVFQFLTFAPPSR